jgi:hypothetical protein
MSPENRQTLQYTNLHAVVPDRVPIIIKEPPLAINADFLPFPSRFHERCHPENPQRPRAFIGTASVPMAIAVVVKIPNPNPASFRNIPIIWEIFSWLRRIIYAKNQGD